MIKKLRPFFCLILAVIIPFCFVACKSSSNDTSPPAVETPGSGGDGGESNTQTPESQTPPEESTPEVSYVLNDAEVNRILKDSFDDCKDFVVNLNSSNLLKDNEYLSKVADKTYPILNYVFYPARFALDVSSPLEKDKIYLRQVSTTFKYLEINTSETNDKIFVKILIDNLSNEKLTAYFYEFDIDKGNVNSIKVSQIYSDDNSSLIKFSETLFDLKNSVFESSVGNISECSNDNRTFFTNNFTAEKFALIDSMRWGLSYYQKFNFSSEKSYDVNESKMPSNEKMIAHFENFGFLDVFDELDRFDTIRNGREFETLDKDYFSNCEGLSIFEYDSVNFVFVINAEEE